MDIRWLQCFVAVAESATFTAAAERLGLTQSTISVQVKALEQELGESLFARGNRRAQLTDAGARLLPHARALLDTVNDIHAEFSSTGAHPRGRLRLGAASMASALLLNRLFETFLVAYPDLTLHIHSTPTTDDTVRQVLAGELDVGFIAVPVTNQHLVLEPVATDDVVLVVGSEHPWADRRSVHSGELTGQTFIAFEQGMSHRRTMDELLARVGASVNIKCETNDPQMVKHLVGRSLGIALIPRWAVGADARAGNLHILALEDENLVRDVNMIYLRRHTSVTRVFVAFCRRYKSTINTGSGSSG
jgi:DNA-binding transcriptional LysR family regulator